VHAYPLVVSFPGDIDRGTATTLSRDVNDTARHMPHPPPTTMPRRRGLPTVAGCSICST